MAYPTGTVTFLFTDIEGSTRLWQSQPEAMKIAQARHNQILLEAIESNNGYFFKDIGDAFCLAFHTAEDALQAAILSQIRLGAEPWGEAPIKVRMGIHTGKASLQDSGEYSGYLTLSHVQRLMSAGHGGQTLLSCTTEPLVRGNLPQDISLRDLGECRLKDMPLPEHVFQLIIPGLRTDFPPLRTLNLFPNNLPAQLTSFIGRKKELADVKRLLRHSHLLTLIGPGGTGKSRLALEVASHQLSHFPHGVWLVELAPISDPSLVPVALLAVLSLPPEVHRPAIEMLCDYVRDKEPLILLDNCEHLIEVCAQVAERLLHASPMLRILATSREALDIAGEVSYRVPSMALPDNMATSDAQHLGTYEAVRLFIDRAVAALPSFTVTNNNAPAVAQICQRLDGIPLALELAAAKLRALSVDQIAERLDDRFRLLTGGRRTALERHQTLRATLDWSYNLLSAPEQVLFRRLSVFAGIWTLEAAESVCADQVAKSDEVYDLLEHLVNKSLVIAEPWHPKTRYRMLETMRQYAGERLVEAGESKLLREQHLQYYLRLAETAAPHLVRPEQVEWLDRLELDHDNLRLALDWALGKEDPEHALRLSAALGTFWLLRYHWLEGAHWLERALAMPSGDPTPAGRAARARALYQDAALADGPDDIVRMQASAEAALVLCEQGDDTLDLAISRFYLGYAYQRNDLVRDAVSLFELAIVDFREMKAVYWECLAQYWLSLCRYWLGESPVSEMLTSSLETARKAGERRLLSYALSNAFEYAWRNGQLPQAQTYLKELDCTDEELDKAPGLGILNSTEHAIFAHSTGDYQRAREFYVRAIRRLELTGDRNIRSVTLYCLAILERDDGQLREAQSICEQALDIQKQLPGEQGRIAHRLALLGQILYLQGNTVARDYFKQALRIVEAVDSRYDKSMVLILVSGFLAERDAVLTAQMLAAVYAYHANHKEVPMFPLFKDNAEDTIARARLALGERSFNTAFAEGEKMTLDDAIELAIKALDEM